MKEMLAFIAWLVHDPSTGAYSVVETQHPDNCIEVGDRNAAVIRDAGYTVDVFCLYTHAPAQSMRPVARPTNE